MKLYYYKDKYGNFGDDLNPWLWNKLIPGLLDGCCFHAPERKEENDKERFLFVGIGSILSGRIPEHPTKIVFGSGGVGAPDVPHLNDRWRFYAVRGPLTARLLNLPKRLSITDAAALIQSIDLPTTSKTYKFSFMPHLISNQAGPWRRICDDAGIHYINPSNNVDDVLKDILSTEILIAEAMHGAIVADALRVPWIPVKAYDYILDFKWKDWCESLGMDYNSFALPSLWNKQAKDSFFAGLRRKVKEDFAINRLSSIMRKHQPILSSDKLLSTATMRLQEQLDFFQRDCARGLFF